MIFTLNRIHFLWFLWLSSLFYSSDLSSKKYNHEISINSKFYIKAPSILIKTLNDDSLIYSRADFNNIIDNHPEFFSDKVLDPEIAYLSQSDLEFNSESGEDRYFTLYAYFLRKKNNSRDCDRVRNEITSIYLNLNKLFHSFQYSGTYFGHQGCRILGFSEFSFIFLRNIGNLEPKPIVSS